MKPSDRDRFLSKIKIAETGCWIWRGAQDDDGYGYFFLHGKLLYAHRASWLLFVGPLGIDQQVLHKCDTPPCVKPDCLWSGTNDDNRTDSVRKKRHAHGHSHGNAKLTDETVKEIRHRYVPEVVTLGSLATEYRVDHSLIWQVVRRKLWRHVA